MSSELPRVPREGIPLGRAAFLGVFGLGAAGIAAAPSLSKALDGVLPSTAGLIPSAGWRIYTVSSPMPTFDPASFALTIGGAVANPVTLSWDAIGKLAMEQQTSDFHCVTGWSVNNVAWEGFRPQTIIDLVKPAADVTHISFVSMEQPYVDQLTMDQFTLKDTIIATAMDGKPISREHGAPLRLVIPEMYGYKSVKWVQEIRFETKPTEGFWEQRGYDTDAWVGRSN